MLQLPWIRFNDVDYFAENDNVIVSHIEVSELVKRNVTVTTPFQSGFIDMSYILHDKNNYEPRTIKLEIIILGPTPQQCHIELDHINSQIFDVIEPFKIKTYLNPERQYTGKVIKQDIDMDRTHDFLKVTFDIMVQPSVYRIVESITWDEMSMYNLLKASRLQYEYIDTPELLWLFKPVALYVDAPAATKMYVNDIEITLNSNDKWYADLPLVIGDNYLTFDSPGPVTLKYEIEVI